MMERRGGGALRRAAMTVGCIVGLLLAAATVPAADAPGAVSGLRAMRDQQRLLAGHLLRRLGFGPNRAEMHEVLRLGLAAYTELQLHPERIDDRSGQRYYLPPPSDDGTSMPPAWLSRMAYSRRQLLEKMTLIWHEHFPSSYLSVGAYTLLRDQENFLRAHALGHFRDLLIGITTDNAMLRYLSNNQNNGRALDAQGHRVPPNENYARELLQLFSLGVNRLHMDGTLVLDPQSRPVPAYSETDVKEIARALTGWTASHPSSIDPENLAEVIPPATFAPNQHDAGTKVVLGTVIAADPDDGAVDVRRVVDVIMAQPNVAPFIAKELILKLATETPSPAYVERVATVFAASDGDLRATVRAILTDDEFYSPAVVRSQYKTPVEYVVGALRGLGVRTTGSNSLYYWTYTTGELVFSPPNVFSFYRPGHKDSLVTAAYVITRDQATDMLTSGKVDGYFDAKWDAADLIRRQRLAANPGRAVDLLAQELLAAPASPELRQALLDYIGPAVSEEKLRGAAWLMLSSPEYQAN
jgi:uncharacterized protein (DUF1800 family)